MADKVQTQLWLRKSTREALRRVAIREGIPMATVVDDILAHALPQREIDAENREALLARAGKVAPR